MKGVYAAVDAVLFCEAYATLRLTWSIYEIAGDVVMKK